MYFSERRKDQEAELLARQYLEEEQTTKMERQRKEFEEKEEMRRMLLEQMERKAAEEASNNLRVKNKNYKLNAFTLLTLCVMFKGIENGANKSRYHITFVQQQMLNIV